MIANTIFTKQNPIKIKYLIDYYFVNIVLVCLLRVSLPAVLFHTQPKCSPTPPTPHHVSDNTKRKVRHSNILRQDKDSNIK